jgi:hypothetical protein
VALFSILCKYIADAVSKLFLWCAGDMYHQASATTGALHLVETHTRTAERNMTDAWKTSQATTINNIKKARHPNPQLDMFVLNISEQMWRTTAYPGIRGAIPSARVHFGAACVGHHLFVVGGAEPTSLRYKHVEGSGGTDVYTLDLRSLKWTKPGATNSHEHLREPLRIAEADVIRAMRRCDEEKMRGMGLGTSFFTLAILPFLLNLFFMLKIF